MFILPQKGICKINFQGSIPIFQIKTLLPASGLLKSKSLMYLKKKTNWWFTFLKALNEKLKLN